MKKLIFSIYVLFIPTIFGAGQTEMVSMLNRLNQGVVNIETTIIYSAYENVESSGGKGIFLSL